MASPSANPWLQAAGLLTALAAALHVGIALFGAPAYRAFGAGEGMAQLAEAGAWQPPLIALGIAAVLALASAYAFAGEHGRPRLPALQPVLALVALVFLARGLLGIPVVIVHEGQYANELEARFAFMLVTSLACLAIGALYALGLLRLRGRLGPRTLAAAAGAAVAMIAMMALMPLPSPGEAGHPLARAHGWLLLAGAAGAVAGVAFQTFRRRPA